MKNLSLVLGAVGLSRLGVACSGPNDQAPLASIAGALQSPSGVVCQPAGGSPESPALVENGALRAPPKETP